MPLTAFLYAHPSKIPGWHFGMSDRVAAAPQPAEPVPPPPPIPYANPARHLQATDPAQLGSGASARDTEETIGGKEGRYYGYRDVVWGEGKVRMHRFLTGREGVGVKPVYGLTA